MIKPKNCPNCNSPKTWLIRILPKRWIFTKYYVECRFCHWCGKTRIGKERAIKAWNKEVIYGD